MQRVDRREFVGLGDLALPVRAPASEAVPGGDAEARFRGPLSISSRREGSHDGS
jgi:hypothetical protein